MPMWESIRFNRQKLGKVLDKLADLEATGEELDHAIIQAVCISLHSSANSNCSGSLQRADYHAQGVDTQEVL